MFKKSLSKSCFGRPPASFLGLHPELEGTHPPGPGCAYIVPGRQRQVALHTRRQHRRSAPLRSLLSVLMVRRRRGLRWNGWQDQCCAGRQDPAGCTARPPTDNRPASHARHHRSFSVSVPSALASPGFGSTSGTERQGNSYSHEYEITRNPKHKRLLQ